MNSDLLTNIDYEDFYRSFQLSDADIMVASIPYDIDLPYAIFETWEGSRWMKRGEAYEELKEKMGEAFDLRTFHNKFLSYGNAPVPVIRKLMLAEWELTDT